MPQTIAPPLGGIMLAINPNGGQVKILTGMGDPNVEGSDNASSDVDSSAVGSLYLRMDGGASTTLYVKTAFVQGAPGTWVGK